MAKNTKSAKDQRIEAQRAQIEAAEAEVQELEGKRQEAEKALSEAAGKVNAATPRGQRFRDLKDQRRQAWVEHNDLDAQATTARRRADRLREELERMEAAS